MRTRPSALTLALLVIVGALTLAPVAMLAFGSFSVGLDTFGRFTGAKYAAAYTDPALLPVLWNTLVFVLGSTLLATALALFLAYLNTRTDIPFKFVFGVLAIVPMMIPHLLFAVAWALLLNPGNGLVNRAFVELLGRPAGPFNAYSLTGMIFVEGLLNMPIAYLIIAPAMAAFDVSLEESSRVCGARPWRTLARITLPVLRPALLAAFVLGVVRCLASYAVPRVLGTPGRVDVLATYLYEMIATGFAPDWGRAAALGMSALAASIALIVVYRALIGEGSRFVTVSSRGWRPSVVALGRWRLPLAAVVALLSFIIVVLPVLVLLYTSLVPYVMLPSAQAFAHMGLRHWSAVFDDPTSLLALRNSLVLALAGATLGVLLSLLIAHVSVRQRGAGAGLLESLTFLSFSFPGIVIGVGFMWFFVHTPLYATLGALLVGYIATYLPYGVRPLASALVQVHVHLEEASAVCGARRLTTLRRIVAPLLIPGIVAAWVLMATMFLRELTLSIVLSRPGSEVLAVQILAYADDGLWGRLSALGMVMILISTALVVLAHMTGARLRAGMAPG